MTDDMKALITIRISSLHAQRAAIDSEIARLERMMTEPTPNEQAAADRRTASRLTLWDWIRQQTKGFTRPQFDAAARASRINVSDASALFDTSIADGIFVRMAGPAERYVASPSLPTPTQFDKEYACEFKPDPVVAELHAWAIRKRSFGWHQFHERYKFHRPGTGVANARAMLRQMMNDGLIVRETDPRDIEETYAAAPTKGETRP